MSAQREPRAIREPAGALTCMHCGAGNPLTATWCGQCLTRFEPPSPAAMQRAAPTESPSSPGAGPKELGIRATEDGVRWACPRCGADHPLDVLVCSVCEATFADLLRPPPRPRPARDPGRAALLSLFMPGAGHAYLGLWGQAIARAVLSTWALAAFLTSTLGVAGARGALAGGVFALASAALWGVSAHDAYREATSRSDSVILGGRGFLWVVLALLAALVAVLLLPAVGAAP